MTTTTNDARILDCGHVPSTHDEHTTGTAHTRDAREICWTCADAEQREALRTETAHFAYLTRDADKHVVLTSWNGSKLADVTEHWTKCVGFGLRTERTYFRAVDVHGQRWHGTSPGFGMYARMRKSA